MISPVLAVEAASSGTSVPIVILVIGLVGFALAYFIVGPGRQRGPKRNADIPLAMRPYHSDEELEGRGMERAMAWAPISASMRGRSAFPRATRCRWKWAT
jgi:hypothetical protein